jgi:nitrous-oxide reductase
MKAIQGRSLALLIIAIFGVGLLYYGCRTQTGPSGPASAAGALEQLALSRDFSPEEATAALETFVPPGKFDEFVMFTSGGHSGSVYLHGLPSMRLLKEIPVFAPNSWQGWAQGTEESMKVLREGTFSPKNPNLPVQTWGDLHHPQLSLTKGDYDGEWCFVSDKPTGRIAVIDLRDFKTKQIVKTPNIVSDHAVFIVGDTEYIVNSTFQPSPGGPGEYAPLEKYKEAYRGAVTFHKFDRKEGRIKLEESFQMQLPPYWQDLAIGGKGASAGWIFLNSMNTEMSIGAEIDGKPLEIGASQNEMDYLHVIPWKKIEAFVRSGDPKVITRNGIKVITLDIAREQGFLYMVPESKSPHGCDVSPGGEYILTAGKLDPHVTAYSFAKILTAIENKTFEKMDEFGFPVLKYDAVREGYIEVGLGPLHTVFDDKGYGYTSLFLDSAVAKFSLGPPHHKPEDSWKLVDKINIHYNIGHLQAPGSNTTRPRGRYLVALNKWTVDRHPSLGPLNPQNAQLIDISGDKMRLLSEAPLIGEPHNSMIIETDKLGAWRTYPEGTDPATMKATPIATRQGQERIERNGNTVHAHMVVIRSHYKPDVIKAKQGDKVILDITNVESAVDATHGFGLHGYNITASIDPGSTERIEFVANQAGVFPFYCTEFCSALHMEMAGWLIVEPR